MQEPARLAILLFLSMFERADFLYILDETGLSKGNLSSHMAKLEDADFVDVEKVFMEKIPRTVYQLTEDGSAAVSAHREILLEALSESMAISRPSSD